MICVFFLCVCDHFFVQKTTKKVSSGTSLNQKFYVDCTWYRKFLRKLEKNYGKVENIQKTI